MGEAELRTEIVQLLAAHAGQPVDYVALFMFLNTVAGGHYQERYPEEVLRPTLSVMLDAGEIEAWAENRRLQHAEPGRTDCVFRLPT